MPDTDDTGRGGADATRVGSPLLEMRDIHKAFGPVVALDGVDLDVEPREVHGLLGGNGAGKTTLMNVLYGLYRADRGSMRLAGQEIEVRSPRDAIAAGVGMVHQNFLQVESYTVTENIVLGTAQPSLPALDLRAAEDQIAGLSERFGLVVDPRARVETLPVGVRQRVEILKALFRGARVLALDEPTTNLTPQEVDHLFASLRAIVDEGMSVIFITHKIRETMAVCDRMTIMRDGRRVATIEKQDTSAKALAEAMVGGAAEAAPVAAVLGESAEPVQDHADPDRAVVGGLRVRVSDLRAANDHGVEALHDVSFELRGGEVLGVAGVAGNGQVELAEVLAGVRQAASGQVVLDGTDLVGRRTAAWLDAGVAYVPEDRHRDGILTAATVTENLVLGAQRSARFSRGRLINWSAARRAATEAMTAYSIKAPGISTQAGNLSGGNMQRVILARAFSRSPQFLILHNPTRGLDIPSTRFVYDRVREATMSGAAVLLLSEDLDELSLLADRVLVLYGGTVVGERLRGDYDPYDLGRLMAGVDA